MTAVVEMEQMDIKYLATPIKGEGDRCEQNEDQASSSVNLEIGETEELDGKAARNEVKINMEDKHSFADKHEKTFKKKISLPAEIDVDVSTAEEFSQEKFAPEASTRVYDFNMVKQKTLPRITFGNNGIFRAFSSHSKSYIVACVLMPLSLVICIAILIFYFLST